MRMSRLMFGIMILGLRADVGGRVGVAQENKPTVVSATPPKQEALTTRKALRLSRPLTLNDFAGMKPRADLEGQLTEITRFTQQAPSSGQAATEKTEVWLGWTAGALYAVFVCHDHHPELIRRHLARRENILTDDTVSLLLDPFADRRKGVLFQVNPMGVQADAAWTEQTNPDYSYDQVWESDARVTKDGWMALIAVPFQSLRFRHAGAQGWGVVLLRNIPRNSEQDAWPKINANVAGTLSQEGTLEGIAGLTGSHNLQFNPYVLAQNQHTVNQENPNNPYFSTRNLEGTAGGEAKAILKESVVLDATVNPDFSQVESDQPQFTVNQRYAVYFPELRPFFLENANYFSTPINLLYTRNIVHPEFGGRATGKVGRTNLGFLAIDDRSPGETVGPGDPLYKKRAFYGVARVSEDVGKNSSVGLIYTDQELAGSWNRIGGVDFTARLSPQWTLTGQSVESSTRQLDGSYSAGPASYLEVNRSGHSLNLDNVYQDYASGFQSQTGFVQTTDFRQEVNSFHYQWFPKHGLVQDYGLEENSKVAFAHQGNRLYHYTMVDPFVQLARNTTIAPLFGENSDTLGPAAYPLLERNRNLTENYVGGVFRSAPRPQISFNLVGTHGGNPNYSPEAGAIPSLLHEEFVQAFVTVQPIGALTIDNTYLLDRNRTPGDRTLTFENQTLRTKINYQFTRALSLRVIGEYDSLLVNPQRTSLVRTKSVATQALLTWLPHPGTAIYVGYNNDLANLNHSLCVKDGPSGACNPNQPILSRSINYLNDGRQFFVKASYLLRF